MIETPSTVYNYRMPRRLLVLSDLHLAPPEPLGSFCEGEALAAFLNQQAGSETTLVLAGDTLDLLYVDPRPRVLDMPRAPDLIRKALVGIRAASWGQALWKAFADFMGRGGHIVVMPGNHDPELAHPETPALLADAWGVGDRRSQIALHTQAAPWTTVVGCSRVHVVHGHRTDSWNDIDPAGVARAMATGESNVTLPPGSRLVLELLNPLKRAIDPATGRRLYPFLDLLKPELKTAFLLLPYLDWKLALTKVPLTLSLCLDATSFLRAVRRLLSLRPMLGGSAASDPPTSSTIEDLLAEAYVLDMETQQRQEDPATVEQKLKSLLTLEPLLSKDKHVVPGTLAAHTGLFRRHAREYLRRVSVAPTFFDPSQLSGDDLAIVERELPPGSGPLVVIAGHTHAARMRDFGDGRIYINTGTWMGHMRLPRLTDDSEVQEWIAELEAGRVPRETPPLLTYAEVTPRGAHCRNWHHS